MISERKLVSAHSSFWRVAMPLADSFVRTMNATLVRFAPPLTGAGVASRNASISELSFRLYAESVSGQMLLVDGVPEQSQRVATIAQDVRDYISKLDRAGPVALATSAEVAEAFQLAQRLAACVATLEPGSKVTVRPRFSGCGVVDDCEGDLLVGDTLYEVKNVERRFRLADLRQLLVYCALNSTSSTFVIRRIGLLNARAGLYYRTSLNALCLSAAGASAVTLLSEIAAYMSSDRPSH